MYFEDIIDLVKGIDPDKFGTYMIKNGWTNIPRTRGRVYVFVRKDGRKTNKVTIPTDRTRKNFNQTMLQAIVDIAAYEGTTVEKVILSVLGGYIRTDDAGRRYFVSNHSDD